MFFLDTNTCIYFLKGSFESVRKNLMALSPNAVKIPSLVKAELLVGAYKSQKKAANLERIEVFLSPFEIFPFEDQMTYTYATIRSQTELSGKNVGPNDLLIAAITRFHEGTLVTHNVKEFSSVEGLKLIDWVE